MLIEPYHTNMTKLAYATNYTVELTVYLTPEQATQARDCVLVYIKDKEKDCDMVCPTCGKSLSC